MSTSILRSFALLTASAVLAAATLTAAKPAAADDTELFVGEAVSPPTARPNIMFILDTSGSMSGNVQSQTPYDGGTDFDGPFDDNRIYWATGTDPLPPCEDDDDNEDFDGDGIPDCDNDLSEQWVHEDAFRCAAAIPGLGSAGLAAMNKAAQWRDRSGTSNDRWENMRSTAHDDDDYVECDADAGVHGPNSSSTNVWARNGASGPWTGSSSSKIDWTSTGQRVTFYSSNWLNWSRSPYITRTRFEIMQEAATNLLNNMQDNVNVGLMRYSNDSGSQADGGMVSHPIERIEDARGPMTTAINGWVPDGWTPISETLYEAHQYFKGGDVVWGRTSDRFSGTNNSDTPSVSTACVSGNCTAAGAKYKSPMTESCQKNFIVFLTDGLPTKDKGSDDPAIKNLIGHACDDEPDADLEEPDSGNCTDDLAKYMQETDLMPSEAGTQNVTSYWIGFGPDVATGTRFLESVASGGGGQYYTAADTAELTQVFTDIVTRILAQTATFSAPTVAVNAFNRTQNLNFLYMSVFKPSQQYRWLGNVKKYSVSATGTIRDVNDNLAVDPNTGFFFDASRSFWSDVVDGSDAELGGAAGELTDPVNRKVYTVTTAESGLLSDEDLSDFKSPANFTIANELFFGVTGTSTALPNRPTPTVGLDGLIDWAYGHDVVDADGDNDTTEARMDMGDPLHSRPATVIYGGPANDPDITLYVTTNDGFLQAVNAKTGRELWSFVPKQMLGRLEQLMVNDEVSGRVYGLDGAVEVVRLDRNGNGTIEPSGTDIDLSGVVEEDEKDKVYLFVGMRRGGVHYYGLDVTVRTAPKLMWRVGQADSGIAAGSSKELPGVGQTWSPAQVARVNVDRTWGSNNPDKLVLIMGGGYDVGQDTISYLADDVGNRIFMIDAVSGNLIWRAGPTADTGAQLQLAKMTNSITGEVRAIDLSGDGFADRMYAADLGGRVWRIDLRNGQTAANLAYGGVFASLGVGDSGGTPDSANRRFFYAPDVAFLKSGSQTWINVAIGSGHREKPITDDVVVNRFYSLRDHNVFSQVTNGQYKATCGVETSPCHQIITDNDTRLVDVTTDVTPAIPTGGVGWKMNLTDDDEKVLAESRTFQNKIFFTTYSPEQREFNDEFCVATVGLNRLYIVDAATGKPVVNFDTAVAGATTVSDRHKELAQGNIAPEAIFVFPTPDNDPNNPNPPAPPPICLVGLESCGTGLANPPVRTYWQQRGVN